MTDTTQSIAFDPDTLTVGELMDVEDVIGAEEFRSISDGQPSFKAVAAIAWILKRRETAETTLADVRALSLAELVAIVSGE